MSLKIKFIILCNRYIFRIQFALIMHFPQASIRFFVKIWNRYYIGITIRVFFRCFPDTLQGIPHGRFIGKEYRFFSYFDIIMYAVFYLQKHFIQMFPYSFQIFFLYRNTFAALSIFANRSIPSILAHSSNFFINPINQFTIIFQQMNRLKAFPLHFLYHVPQFDCPILALLQQFQRCILFFCPDGRLYFIMSLSKQI